MSLDGVVVAVLAGGEGRRMGGLKALRPFRGAPLIVHALRLARAWSPDVVVCVRDRAQLGAAVDAPMALDRPDIPGPLAGLTAALEHASTRDAGLLFTLPCDMPRLPADLPARLAGALGEGSAALPRIMGELQPTCGLWRTGALHALPAYLASGQSSLRGFARAAGLSILDIADAEAPAFANANSPEELAKLEEEAP